MQITINVETLLWIAGAIGLIGGAIAYMKKGTEPILRPYRQMRSDVKELKQRKLSCDLKFKHDQQLLEELKENDKMTIKALMLLMKHAETGNCTGEVAAGRKELEDYLIDKD